MPTGGDLEIELGDFVLTHRLGRGAQGEVWAGRHRLTGTPTAIKLGRRVASRSVDLERWLSEIRAAASLNHPNIALTLDCGDVPDAAVRRAPDVLHRDGVWLALELASGGTLSDRLGRLDWPRLYGVLRDLLSALGHSHAHGVLHRDVKPDNVLFTTADSWIPLLSDFGFAAGGWTGKPQVAGTPAFTAPEQLAGEWWAEGPSTDLYALGSIAWWAATGRAPFGEGDVRLVAYAHRTAPLPEFASRFPVPAGFEEWVRTLLEKQPERRFARAADALSALGDLASDTWRVPTVPARSDVEPPPRTEGRGVGLVGIRRLPIVGRESERDALWAALQSTLRNRRTEVVLLPGPRGNGADRLAEWVARLGHAAGLAEPILVDRRLEDWLRGELKVALMTQPEEHASRLTHGGGPTAEACRTAIQTYLTEGTGLLDAAVAWVEHVVDWRCPVFRLGAAALDDPAITGLLSYLAGRADPALVVVVCERFEQQAFEARLARFPTQSIPVGPLTMAERLEVIAAALPLQTELAHRLATSTGGLPGTIAATLEGWVMGGRLKPSEGGLALVDDTGPFLPRSMLDAARAHVTAMNEAHPRWERPLRMLAVLGDGTAFDRWSLACDAAGVPFTQADAAGLAQHNMVLAAADNTWNLAHPVLTEALLDSLPDDERSATYRAAAAVIGLDDLVRYAKLLQRAGDLEAAVEALGRDFARGRQAPPSPAHGRLMNELLEQLERTSDPLYGAALFARFQGATHEEFARLTDRALAWIADTGNARYQNEALLNRALVLEREGSISDAEALLTSLVATTDGEERSDCYFRLSALEANRDRLDRAREYAVAALGLATTPVGRIQARLAFAYATSAPDDLPDALRIMDTAVEEAREAVTIRLAPALLARARVLERMGRLEQARADCAEAVRIRERRGWFSSDANLSVALLDLDLNEARAAVEQFESILRGGRYAGLRHIARVGAVAAYGALGEWASAHRHLVALPDEAPAFPEYALYLERAADLAATAGRDEIVLRIFRLLGRSNAVHASIRPVPRQLGPYAVVGRRASAQYRVHGLDGRPAVLEASPIVADVVPVRHPGIVPVVDAGDDGDVPWRVYDWDGEHDLVAHGAMSDWAEVADLAASLLESVAAMHALGWVVGDLRPETVVRVGTRWRILRVCGAEGASRDADLEGLGRVVGWAAEGLGLDAAHAAWVDRLVGRRGTRFHDASTALHALHRLDPGRGHDDWPALDFEEIALVGRKTAQDALWRTMGAVEREGTPRAVVVRGPAGIGRTALLDWFGIVAELSGRATVFRLHPRDGHSGLREAVREALGDDPSRVAERLVRRGVAPGGLSAIRRLMGALEGPTTHGLLAAASQLFARLAAGRVAVVLVDEAERSEDALRLADVTLGRDRAVLVVLATADEALARLPDEAAWVARLAKQERVDVCALPPLDPNQSRAFLPADVVEDRVARIVERAGGNPAFLTALASGDAEAASLVEAWDALARRCLAEEGWTWPLLAAAVLGEAVDTAEWAATAQALDAPVPRGLTTRLRAQRLARLDGSTFRFTHAMFREALIGAVDRADIVRAHNAAAVGVLDAGRRGRHLLAAGRHEDAVHALLQGIEEAREGAPRVTLALMDDALHALELSGAEPADPRVAQTMRERIGVAEQAMSDSLHHAALEAFRQWADVWGTDADQLEAMLDMARVETRAGDVPNAVLRLNSVLRQARETGESRLISRTLHALAGTLKTGGDPGVCDVRLEARALEPPGSVRWAAMGLMLAHDLGEAGRAREGQAVLAEVAPILREAGSRFEPEILNVEGELFRMDGDFAAAVERFEASASARASRLLPPTHPLLNLALTHLQNADPVAAGAALARCAMPFELPLAWVWNALDVGVGAGQRDWNRVERAVERLESVRSAVGNADALRILHASRRRAQEHDRGALAVRIAEVAHTAARGLGRDYAGRIHDSEV